MNRFQTAFDLKLRRYALVLKLAALAAKWKEPAKDALDTLVLNAVDLQALDEYEQTDYTPFDPTIKRTEASIKHRATGACFKVGRCRLTVSKPELKASAPGTKM
jgi:hypothetical protein